MSICLVAIFKNESHILNEWINHYLLEGIDHFFLIDNGSTDDYKNIINNYNDKITLVIDYTKYAQIQLYNKHFLDACKKYDWLIVVDLDEFIYSRLTFKRIKDYLLSLDDDIVQIAIPWKMFGSNGYTEQPDSVLKSFTKRNEHKNQTNGKCITRTKCLKYIRQHTAQCIGKQILSDGNICNINTVYDLNNIKENDLNLHLNHYPIQSYNWFMKVKNTRGDVLDKMSNRVRNDKYFKDYDNNTVEDFELCNKNRIILSQYLVIKYLTVSGFF